jgi:hypothetical protein
VGGEQPVALTDLEAGVVAELGGAEDEPAPRGLAGGRVDHARGDPEEGGVAVNGTAGSVGQGAPARWSRMAAAAWRPSRAATSAVSAR